jgi:PAS domain-containing protein
MVVGTAQDITDRRRVDDELERQTARLRLILDSLSEGVVVADAGGRLVAANPAATALIGIPPFTQRSTRPGSWSMEFPLFLPDGVTPYPEDRLPLTLALRGHSIDQEEMVVRPPGSSTGVTLSVTGRPLVASDGSIAGAVIVLDDVSDRRSADHVPGRGATVQRSTERPHGG